MQAGTTSASLTLLASTMTTQTQKRTMVVRKAVSLLFLALFLFLQTLAAVPGLHRHFHHDADQADHQCVVTLLLQGNLEAASSFVSVMLPAAQVSVIPLRPAFIRVAIDYRLLPGRAPPVFPA
ncbi:MAG TPA: hypothetical protein VG754_11900 [Verrucomicrobiae bacterium]|nr:hypothetical protein [Verrucomicrobiae bacterium]